MIQHFVSKHRTNIFCVFSNIFCSTSPGLPPPGGHVAVGEGADQQADARHHEGDQHARDDDRL